MSYTIETHLISNAFGNAWKSVFDGKGGMDAEEVHSRFKNRFNVIISESPYAKFLTFGSEQDYVMFMLEWS